MTITYHNPEPPHYTTSYHETPFPSWAIILHLILTLGTCFCWAPIWLIHYAIHQRTTVTHTHYR